MSVKRTRQNASQLANKHQWLKSAADPWLTFLNWNHYCRAVVEQRVLV